MSGNCKCGTYRPYRDDIAGRNIAPAMHLDACVNCGIVPAQPAIERTTEVPQDTKPLLGDMVSNAMDKIGVTKVTEAITKATGFDCGCNKRRQQLNNLHRSMQG